MSYDPSNHYSELLNKRHSLELKRSRLEHEILVIDLETKQLLDRLNVLVKPDVERLPPTIPKE